MTRYINAYSYFNPKKKRVWALAECNELSQGGISGNLSMQHVIDRLNTRGIILTADEKLRLTKGESIGRTIGKSQFENLTETDRHVASGGTEQEISIRKGTFIPADKVADFSSDLPQVSFEIGSLKD